MRTSKPTAEAFGRVLAGLVMAALAIYIVVWILFKGMWDSFVPTLFPGAVEQGLVAKTISWWTAFLMSGALGLLLVWSRWMLKTVNRSASERVPLLEIKVNAVAAHLGIDLDRAIQAEIGALSRKSKIQAIRLYRAWTGADLRSAKKFVDGLLQSAEPPSGSSSAPEATAGQQGA